MGHQPDLDQWLIYIPTGERRTHRLEGLHSDDPLACAANPYLTTNSVGRRNEWARERPFDAILTDVADVIHIQIDAYRFHNKGVGQVLSPFIHLGDGLVVPVITPYWRVVTGASSWCVGKV